MSIYGTFSHGGDYTAKYLDFSANISPLGVPDSVRDALAELVEGNTLASYPDPFCRDLRRQIAEKEGLTEEQVLCGNGAVDLIYRVANAFCPGKALILEPTFTEYTKALAEAGCLVKKAILKPHYRDDGVLAASSFSLPEGFAKLLTPDLDLFVFCSPNNPTGRSLQKEELTELFETCKERNIRVLWDACFSDFYDAEDSPDRQQEMDAFLRSCVREYPNLLVLKSLTKSYAIPGLRLGYLLCSDEMLLEQIAKYGAPWSVSAAAQVAGVAALQDEEYLRRAQELVMKEKKRVWLDILLMGLFCRRGDGNFLLLHTEREDLAEALKRRGILVRDCSDFSGLDSHYIRFAVRTREENDKLLDALWAEIKGGETP